MRAAGRTTLRASLVGLLLFAARAAFADDAAQPVGEGGAQDAGVGEAVTERPGAPRPPAIVEPDEAPARPPPFSEDVGGGTLPRTRHVDVGVGFVFISPVANSLEVAPPKMQYEPGPGATGYARILLHPYLQAAAVFSWATHALEADEDALGLRGLSRTGNMTAYRLEAHVMPTLPIGERVRLFGILGLGWGRIEFGTMHADYDGDFVIRGRGASYFDVPAGVGTSIEAIPGWLGVDIAIWAAPTFAKDGTAHTELKAIDGAGHARTVGPLPEVPIWFVQSIGLSVLL